MKRSSARGGAPSAAARCPWPGTQRGQWRRPIAAWLIAGFSLVIAAVVTGSLLASHGTRSATDELARIRAEIEPLTHASRDLGESSAAFDRAVLAYLGTDSAKDRDTLTDAAAALARLLVSHLSRAGLGVETAATAVEGIRLAGTGRYDLVVLDLVLADDDGRHVLARLRDGPATRTLPVFVMSARLSPGVRAECLQLAAEAVFEKPLDGGAVAGAVVERLRRRAGPPQMPSAAEPAAATAVTQAPGPAAPASHQARILLAEDDDMVASIVKHRLRKAGHLVEHVPTEPKPCGGWSSQLRTWSSSSSRCRAWKDMLYLEM